MSPLIYVAIAAVIIIIIVLIIFLSKKEEDPRQRIQPRKITPNNNKSSDEEEPAEEEVKKYFVPEIKPIDLKPTQRKPRPVIDTTSTVPFSLNRRPIKLKDTNLCIDADSKNWFLSTNQPINLYPCHGKNNQQLSTSELGHLFFSFPPKCMSVNSVSINEPVKQNPCDNIASEQQWWEYDEKQRIRLSNNPSFCLGVASAQANTSLQIQTCSDSNNQKWIVN